MKGNTTQLCLALATVGLMLASTGCSLPAIEGIFDDRDFAVFDDTPEARGQVDDEVLLVFVDIDDNTQTMRTVSVDLKVIDTLDVGVALDIGDGSFDDDRPSIEAVEGPLVTEQIASGTLVTVDADRAAKAVATGGTVTLSENGSTIAGDFKVDLDDGGYLEGTFRSAE